MPETNAWVPLLHPVAINTAELQLKEQILR